MKRALVLGAGGFIGSHMVNRLKSEGYFVKGVDIKFPEFEKLKADIFLIRDLSHEDKWDFHLDVDEIYQFAALMGGAGFIFTGDNDAQVMLESSAINNILCREMVREGFKGKVFYSSSACIYPASIQEDSDNKGLKESDAYPVWPDSEYGWEKLFSERLYLSCNRNFGIDIRIARFHNIYGPYGTYIDPKAKVPAAMCRKVANAVLDLKAGVDCHKIEVWGDGQQTRSFLYISDCIDAVRLLVASDFKEPINIGSEEMISINNLAKMVIDISGKDIKITNVKSNALGVRGRNSDNTLIESILGWEPKFTLRQGMEKTYEWINKQVNK